MSSFSVAAGVDGVGDGVGDDDGDGEGEGNIRLSHDRKLISDMNSYLGMQASE